MREKERIDAEMHLLSSQCQALMLNTQIVDMTIQAFDVFPLPYMLGHLFGTYILVTMKFMTLTVFPGAIALTFPIDPSIVAIS